MVPVRLLGEAHMRAAVGGGNIQDHVPWSLGPLALDQLLVAPVVHTRLGGNAIGQIAATRLCVLAHQFGIELRVPVAVADAVLALISGLPGAQPSIFWSIQDKLVTCESFI